MEIRYVRYVQYRMTRKKGRQFQIFILPTRPTIETGTYVGLGSKVFKSCVDISHRNNSYVWVARGRVKACHPHVRIHTQKRSWDFILRLRSSTKKAWILFWAVGVGCLITRTPTRPPNEQPMARGKCFI